MSKRALTPEDIEWEEPSLSRAGGVCEQLRCQLAEMRAALHARKGRWAVLEAFDKPNAATSYANQLKKREDSRILGLEFAGRKMIDGGSKLYVRAKP